MRREGPVAHRERLSLLKSSGNRRSWRPVVPCRTRWNPLGIGNRAIVMLILSGCPGNANRPTSIFLLRFAGAAAIEYFWNRSTFAREIPVSSLPVLGHRQSETQRVETDPHLTYPVARLFFRAFTGSRPAARITSLATRGVISKSSFPVLKCIVWSEA